MINECKCKHEEQRIRKTRFLERVSDHRVSSFPSASALHSHLTLDLMSEALSSSLFLVHWNPDAAESGEEDGETASLSKLEEEGEGGREITN